MSLARGHSVGCPAPLVTAPLTAHPYARRSTPTLSPLPLAVFLPTLSMVSQKFSWPGHRAHRMEAYVRVSSWDLRGKTAISLCAHSSLLGNRITLVRGSTAFRRIDLGCPPFSAPHSQWCVLAGPQGIRCRGIRGWHLDCYHLWTRRATRSTGQDSLWASAKLASGSRCHLR